MGIKEEIITELETTRRAYLQLVESVPEEFYGHPSANPAWTIGDVLHHITLGPAAVRAEVWMIRHAGWLFSTLLNNFTAGIFNRGNALFAHRPKRVTPEILVQAYDRGHAGLLASIDTMQDGDFSKSVRYPDAFVEELAGVVTVERLLRYTTEHFDDHASQIRERLG